MQVALICSWLASEWMGILGSMNQCLPFKAGLALNSLIRLRSAKMPGISAVLIKCLVVPLPWG